MVSKYRDILEPHNDKKHPQRSQSARSTGIPPRIKREHLLWNISPSGMFAIAPIPFPQSWSRFSLHCILDSSTISGEVENGVSIRRYDSGIGDDHTSTAASEGDLSSTGVTHGPDAISEALSTLSSEVRPSLPADSKGKNVKDILRSLVSPPSDDVTVDPNLLPPSFLGSMGDMTRESFRSFDRWALRFYTWADDARVPPSTVCLTVSGLVFVGKKGSKMNSALQTCEPQQCLPSTYGAYFPCDSPPSHLIVLFIYLNMSAGDLESIPVVLSEKALVNFWKSLQQKSFWNLLHSCPPPPHLLGFLTSFLLSLKYTRTDSQRMSLKENRSPVLDDVDGKLFLFSISLIFNDTLLSSPLLLI